MNMSVPRNQRSLGVGWACTPLSIPIGNSGRVYDPQHPFIKEGRERCNGCERSGRDSTY